MICNCPTGTDKAGTSHQPMCDLVRNKVPQTTATRQSVNYRYDFLDTDFLHFMAEIAHYGAEKYGDLNWQKSRLAGDKAPLNHIYMHLHQYKLKILHDKFETRGHQLAAIAFNAMMEFYWLQQEEKDK